MSLEKLPSFEMSVIFLFSSSKKIMSLKSIPLFCLNLKKKFQGIGKNCMNHFTTGNAMGERIVYFPNAVLCLLYRGTCT